MSLAIAGGVVMLAACQTGDKDTPTELPRTLREASALFRQASFKVEFSPEDPEAPAFTYAKSEGGGQRLDLHDLSDEPVSIIVEGTFSIIGELETVTYCAPAPEEVECNVIGPEHDDAPWIRLMTGMFGWLLDAEGLADAERVGIVQIAETRRESIAGREATCFDVRLGGLDDDSAGEVDAIACFTADGIPIQIGIPWDEDIALITATRIEQPTEADFVPPAPVTD